MTEEEHPDDCMCSACLGPPDQCGLVDPQDPTSPCCVLRPGHTGPHRKWFHCTVPTDWIMVMVMEATPDEQADRDEYLAMLAEKRATVDASLATISSRMTAAQLATWNYVYMWAHPQGDEDNKNLHERRLAFLDRARQDIPWLLDTLKAALAEADALRIQRNVYADIVHDMRGHETVATSKK